MSTDNNNESGADLKALLRAVERLSSASGASAERDKHLAELTKDLRGEQKEHTAAVQHLQTRVALLDVHVASIRRLLWIVGGAAMTGVVKMVFDVLMASRG